MRKTQSLSITLPHEMAEEVRSKVASGAYATESEVIRDGLRALKAQDDALEHWLRTEGVARYEAFRRDPTAIKPAAQVFANLRKRHEQRLKKERRG
jgi:putative addiction module CopG family antidote